MTTPATCSRLATPAAQRRSLLAAAVLVGLLAACGGPASRPDPGAAVPANVSDASLPTTIQTTEHRGQDDLLSAGLGLDGLRAPLPPAFADPEQPTAAELRRRALWTNWRGIADLSPAGGFGTVYGAVPSVPGREYHALLRLPGRHAGHRVLLQLPDAFDAKSRCLLVTASSGSRGIFGAIATAGAWGLPRGCAVAYTDKGAGTDLFDAASGESAGLDGRLTDTPEAQTFRPASVTASPWIAYRHAHSQDNPEADWGRHLRQAAEFGLQQLNRALPAQAPFTLANTRIIALGLSNAGGAVLRAAEIDEDWLDGVVAVAPNVLAPSGGRALFDYGTEAALWMACAQAAPALRDAPAPLPAAALAAQREAACSALLGAGLVTAAEPAQQAYDRLRASGWTDAALRAGSLSTAFDLWRSVGVTYASAYGRYRYDTMPCGLAFAVLDGERKPRPSTRAERAAWWSDSSGVGPGAGVQLVPRDPAAKNDLSCLRAMWEGSDGVAVDLRAGVEATRAGLPRATLPVLVIHGVDDGLVPEAFSGGAYVAAVRQSASRPLNYWRVHQAQHFDAFLALPDFGGRYVPLMPYVYAGLDALWRQLEGGPAIIDHEIRPAARRLRDDGAVELLSAEGLRLPGA